MFANVCMKYTTGGSRIRKIRALSLSLESLLNEIFSKVNEGFKR